MTESHVPDNRVNAVCNWFAAMDPLLTKPGASTYLTCAIYVPYAHRLRKASVACYELASGGTFTIDLMQADDGDAQAGASVAQLTNAVIDAAVEAGKVEALDLPLTDDDKQLTAGGRYYFLKCTGDNAGDLIKMPALSIAVEASEHSAL